ncbi:MAG: phytanoyl-CoA dioxygenase family protein [Rhodospirillaceae bacterium]|jgi:non-haem Fe2+, alpha-ketoglutarate-dependent halogenase|nr:phytanoyl-CoA dioxygenase family protein [Rhodospirillaceae bacterium]MBT5457717.1 phytanoyl-CoA dioxygenase family protein [Rhodospirillaceae bacterium]
MPKALNTEQVDQYQRDGFVSPVRVVSEDDAALFRRQMEDAEAAGDLKVINQTKFYLRFPWVHKMATQPALLDAVEDLIGPNIMLYHNTVWFKEGGDGAYVSWHQDNTYFGHDPCEVLTAWLAITPATIENGCMQFMPGTQKLGQLDLKEADIHGSNMLTSGQTADFDPTSVEPFPVELQPGECSIHHAFLVHGSLPNNAPDRRMGITFIYHPPQLGQIGSNRTSALLVRGEDPYGKFDHEKAPDETDREGNIARHEKAVSAYRAKVRELGNLTIARMD